MHVRIDAAGRVVIPKAVRDELGLEPGQRLELDTRDGDLHLHVRAPRMRIEGRGRDARVVTDEPMPTLTDDVARATLDAVRDRR
ncbi:MAG: AbrB/MazE/SpoVT family DNA-binding domain-containing protein [Solirubrobacteraceae bacterium]|jgi:AbrB family looped-hinge helix DNA binding protein|nr:AbrB/MazE/SpoVT family DNA-binding domain-containing protein [Solirubrobacteraceae bacterium]